MMNTETNQNLLLVLLKSALLETALDEGVKQSLTQEKVKEMLALSMPQDLSHMLHMSLCMNGLQSLEGDIAPMLQRQEILALYRYETSNYETNRIYKAFCENGIDFIVLKGAYIRKLYPKEYMRTSCDVDILVKKTRLEQAKRILTESFGYTQQLTGDHDVAFANKKGDFHIELHFSLSVGEIQSAAKLLSEVWDYAMPSNHQQSAYELAPEYLIMYLLTHMAAHFNGGGCGVRPFMDLYLIQTKLEYNKEELDKLLCESGLCEFAEAAFALSNVWFGKEKHTALTQNIQDFLFRSGIYGSLENLAAIKRAKGGSSAKGILKRLFLPMERMKRYYPALEKYPVLLPYFWLVRIGKVVVSGRTSRAIAEVKMSAGASEDKVQSIKKLFDDLGI